MFRKIQLLRSIIVPMLFAVVAGASAQSDPSIEIHMGKHYIWYSKKSVWDAHKTDIRPYFNYADRIFAQIIKDWGVPMPKRRFYVWIMPNAGTGAFAAGDISEIHSVIGKTAAGIGLNAECCWDVVHGVKGYFGYTFIAHETTNNLTGQLVTSNWPRDWWADDISPFPAMTAVHAEAEIGRTDISTLHGHEFVHDRLYQMFKAIQAHYGWSVFRRMFMLIKGDKLNLANLNHGWNPSKILTAYVSAYMVLGSGDSLANMNRYFSGVVPSYDESATREVMLARAEWKNHGGTGAAFLAGHYQTLAPSSEVSVKRPSPQDLTLKPGQSRTVTIDVAVQPHLAGIQLTASNLPPGVTARIVGKRSYRDVGRGSFSEFQLTLAAISDASEGGSTVVIKCSTPGLSAEAEPFATLPVLLTAHTNETSVDLRSSANEYGIAAPGLTLGDNGGLDGHGWAYAASAIGRGLHVNSIDFAFGPAATGLPGTCNAVSGRTIPLPRGRYSALAMLASASGGNREDRTFTVTYTDGSTHSYTQSISDWTTPQSYPGESIALKMPIAAVNHGTFTSDHYLYEYRFSLNPSKTLKSISLPVGDHPGIAVLAVTLVRKK